MSTIDIVGHFGSRFSYATHAVELSRRLAREELLGTCHNLDEVALEDYRDLSEHLRFGLPPATGEPTPPPSKSAILITAPTEAIEGFASVYERAALFVCPNTDRLSEEALRAARCFDELITPSTYCREVLFQSLLQGAPNPPTKRTSFAILGLGAHDVFLEGRRDAERRRAQRRHRNRSPRFVHFTSDGFWPGRKGTEELLEAWPTIWDAIGDEKAAFPELVIHCTRALYDTLSYAIEDRLQALRDAGRSSDGAPYHYVSVRCGASPRGVMPSTLFELMADADLVVQPSRSEGFGMIQLSALVAGIPLATTCQSGHRDFLSCFERGQDWELIRPALEADAEAQGRVTMAPLEGEPGLAPALDPELLAEDVIHAWNRLGPRPPKPPDAEEQIRSFLWRRAASFTWEAQLEMWVRYAQLLAGGVRPSELGAPFADPFPISAEQESSRLGVSWIDLHERGFAVDPNEREDTDREP